jgi:hypothetical protein
MSENPAANAVHALPLEYPSNLEPIYVNLAMIAHSPVEVVIDFARILPAMIKARVCSRVILSPLGAKILSRALAENIAKYETQFGEIRVPEGPSLAEQLFKKPPSDSPQDPSHPDSPQEG